MLPDGNDRLYMANAQRIMYMNLTDNSVHQVLSLPGNTSFAWTFSADRRYLIIYCDKGLMSIDIRKRVLTSSTLSDINLPEKKR